MTVPYCNRIDCFLDVLDEKDVDEMIGCDKNCDNCNDYEEIKGPLEER